MNQSAANQSRIGELGEQNTARQTTDTKMERLGLFSDSRFAATTTPPSPPFASSWVLPMVYSPKQSSRVWQIGFDVLSNEIVTVFGLKEGKLQTSTTVSTPNSRFTSHQRASTAIMKKFTDKTETEGYTLSPESTDTDAPPFVMLADSKTPEEIAAFLPAWMQPKYDGVRGVIRKKGDDVEIFSRNRLSMSHLKPIFATDALKLFRFLPEGTVIDGEMIVVDENGVENFELTTSAVRTIVGTLPEYADRLRLVIFTIIHPDLKTPFEDRKELLDLAFEQARPSVFRLAPTLLAKTPKDVDRLHDEFVELGHEGGVLYQVCSVYKPNKRALVKVKTFHTTEGIIDSVTGCKGGRETDAARLMVKIWDDSLVPMRPAVSLEQRRLWFAHPELIVGKTVTFKHQGITSHGKPRFPVALAIRDYE